MSAAEPAATTQARTVARRVWDQLPALVVASSVVCAAIVVAVLVAPGVTPTAVVLWALLVAPVFAGLVGVTTDVLNGAEVRVFGFHRYVRHTVRLALASAAVPAVAAVCSLVSLEVLHQTHATITLVPLAVSGAVTVLGSLAGLLALPVAVRVPSLRGPSLALFCLRAVARRPIPVVGVLAVGVLGLWAAVTWSASVVVLVPGPFALVLVLAASATVSGDPIWRLLDEEGSTAPAR
ncbi:hypothetical protein [Curtobacterium sp. MCBD17_019]|uniref:hypothetical protein n=1 Tax=Curtobacterium sp. MCBD17_019 TaxID=2175669 RepID=UPI000DA7D8E6|nr:hypothetical protein [Curtobacterium sp. MCBD17_019]PZE73897.1 hypothetical protein DEI82_12640 [Curtobacterium sp. MCBD17_019]